MTLLRKSVGVVCLATGLVLPMRLRGGGVTIITHGLEGNIDDWVISMAGRILQYPLFPGTKSTCYEIYFTSVGNQHVISWRRLAGDAPTTAESGEIIVKLDWRQLAKRHVT